MTLHNNPLGNGFFVSGQVVVGVQAVGLDQSHTDIGGLGKFLDNG